MHPVGSKSSTSGYASFQGPNCVTKLFSDLHAPVKDDSVLVKNSLTIQVAGA